MLFPQIRARARARVRACLCVYTYYSFHATVLGPFSSYAVLLEDYPTLHPGCMVQRFEVRAIVTLDV